MKRPISNSKGIGTIIPVSRYPTQDELKAVMQEGLKNLNKKVRRNQSHIDKTNLSGQGALTQVPLYRLKPLLERVQGLQAIRGHKPENWRKPTYGNLDYLIAHNMGWISQEEERADRAVYEERRNRSLKSCHRYSFQTRNLERFEKEPSLSGAGGFVPETSTAILHDTNLTDGSKLLALKLMEETYRRNRTGRWLNITVTYLMNALNRSRRTIQNYLRILEHFGYIDASVILGETSKMCVGLKIRLLEPLFAKHHREKWPEKRTNPDVQIDSQKYYSLYKKMEEGATLPVLAWALKCMDGVYRSLRREIAPLSPLPDSFQLKI